MTSVPRPSYVIEQADPDYPPVRLWENTAGEVWACCASDHGPFCRLCQRADEVLVSLIENVADGNMLARAQPNGEFEFHMTAKGNAAAENLVHGTVEGAQLWADLQGKLGDR